MAEKKLEKEHVEKIRSLQNELMKNNNDLGFITKEIYLTEERVRQLKIEQEKIWNAYKNLNEQENKLVDMLKEYYGDGQIDIEKGIFISE